MVVFSLDSRQWSAGLGETDITEDSSTEEALGDTEIPADDPNAGTRPNAGLLTN